MLEREQEVLLSGKDKQTVNFLLHEWLQKVPWMLVPNAPGPLRNLELLVVYQLVPKAHQGKKTKHIRETS